jgi:Ca2+-binding EF-hand superfamily protein
MSDNLDEDARKAVQSLFLDIDGNHDGQVSAFELNLAMQMIGNLSYSEEKGIADIKAFMSESGNAGKETMNSEEFQKFILPQIKLKLVRADPAPMQLTRIFQDADVDKSGYLTVDELNNVLQKYSETRVDKTELLRIFQEFDTDGDQKLSIQEFVKLMSQEMV